jgi:catalase (peroxidase I)
MARLTRGGSLNENHQHKDQPLKTAADYREAQFKRMARERVRIVAYLQKAATIGRDFAAESIRDRIEALADINAELERLGAFEGAE